VNVRILEVDAERRRLSLSLKRVDEGMPPQPGVGDEPAEPTIDLSEDVFSDSAPAAPAAEMTDDDDVEADPLDDETDDDAEPDDEPSDEPSDDDSDDSAPQ
jgi:small subunit ribosomal protein S1